MTPNFFLDKECSILCKKSCKVRLSIEWIGEWEKVLFDYWWCATCVWSNYVLIALIALKTSNNFLYLHFILLLTWSYTVFVFCLFLLLRKKVCTFSSAFLYAHIHTNQTATYWTKVFQKKLYFEISLLSFIHKILEQNFYLYVTVYLVWIWTYKNANKKVHAFLVQITVFLICFSKTLFLFSKAFFFK